MQLFVLGMHRSGTSALARILNLLGVYFGGENVGIGRNAENPKGFWERRDVRDLNDAILFNAGCDWDCASKLDLSALPAERRARYESLAADVVMNMDAHRPWFVKEPRLCLLFPIWRQVAELPVCIHVVRNPLAVAQSLRARNGMPLDAGLALWELYQHRALAASAGLPRFCVAYEDLVESPWETTRAIFGGLSQTDVAGLRLPAERELATGVDPGLQRQRRSSADLKEQATDSQLTLYAALRDACLGNAEPQDASMRNANLAEIAPAPLSDACLATLGDYEATVDVVARTVRANARRHDRSDANAQLQLALKRLELEHATAYMGEAQKRTRALERQSDRLRDAQADLRARLALSEDRATQAEDRATQAEERAAKAERRAERAEQREARATQPAAASAATRRNRIKRAVPDWDATLAHQEIKVSELRETANALQGSIGRLLDSRRWGFGGWALAPFALLGRRGGAKTLGARHAALADAQALAERALGSLGAAHRQSVGAWMAMLPNQTMAVRAILQADKSRDERLARMLAERHLLVAERNLQMARLREHVDSLIELCAEIRASRRWRIGHLLLSLPVLALGRGRPQTDLDAAQRAIEAHQRSPAPPARLAALPAAEPSRPSKPIGARRPAPRGPYRPPAIYQPDAEARVDIVVCVHNALDHARRCLRSVRSRTSVAFRLIVVNDGSDEATTAWLRGLTDVELIETDGPLGYTRAANLGLAAATAPRVALLNSDTIVPRLWIEGLLECMASGDGAGIVGPLSNAASWQSIPERYEENGGWAVNRLPQGHTVDEYGELVHLASERRFPRVDLLNGFCLLIDRAVIDRIGYLDEASFPRGYGEENDYCLRARDAGFQLAVADHVFVYHAKSQSFGAAARGALARDGAHTLEAKHGAARIDAATRTLRDAPELAAIRAAVEARLTRRGLAAQRPPAATVGWRVLFVLPVKGGSGGANSVVQEAAAMRRLGVDAQVAVPGRYQDEFLSFHADYDAQGVLLFYASDEELFAFAADFHVIVATLWSTPALLAPVRARWPDKLYVYYVQDYEPWFFPNEPANRRIAEQSYALFEDMALMAKTDWLCRIVRERHGRHVYRIAPSLDHDVFHPPVLPRPDDGLCVAAMVRPSTPRRAPLRTLRALKGLMNAAEREGRPVRLATFGCARRDVESYAARHAPGENLTDFACDHRGLLTRRQVADLFRSADIFIDLSDYQAFGRTGLEAMACGCAVIVPAEGGAGEYAKGGLNACVVDTKSEDAIAAALRSLIDDDELRERLRGEALATAARFDVRRACLSELAVFRTAWRARSAERAFAADAYALGQEPMDLGE